MRLTNVVCNVKHKQAHIIIPFLLYLPFHGGFKIPKPETIEVNDDEQQENMEVE